MANEELHQRGYIAERGLRGGRFGSYEEFNIGATSVRELVRAGVVATIPGEIGFTFKEYRAPKKPESVKPDRVFVQRRSGQLTPVAVGEHKAPAKLRTDKELLKAAEQSLFAAAALGAKVGVTTNGARFFYVNVDASLAKGEIVYFEEKRDFNPGVLHNLLAGDAGVEKDPKPLAESVWQMIWHATKEEPKACLLTFVEIFVLKFLSDNLPKSMLPESYSFYTLLLDQNQFQQKYGASPIEYYVKRIRPHIRTLFPDNVAAKDAALPEMFGVKTVVSKTSIINGFVFLKSGNHSVGSYNRTFVDILIAFKNFGPLTSIDPEFKLRLYETFLKQSARQQKLGQFFTPRNVVKPMIRMAELDKLPEGAVVLDPAAGVGGFVLEPMLIPGSLTGNIQFHNGLPTRKVKLIGVDVDANTHILGKANMLIHLAEAVRDPKTSIPGLNQLMAETFVLMNTNETLGALEHPVIGRADVILTNPPYVTQGSRIYKEEINALKGTRGDIDIKDYYDRSGLGLESLFLRYISGALSPGGRAFVIVPLGMLNRTDPGPKAKLLEECNVLASIALPRNTFFNTSQLTYILVLQRRRTPADDRPDVFCGTVRSIGESLDHRRIPTPDENDLEDIADLFIQFVNGDRDAVKQSRIVKIASAVEFGKDNRWDVARFWTGDELVSLGQRESAIARLDFIDEATDELQQIAAEMKEAKDDLMRLKAVPMVEVALSDETKFRVRAGERIRGEDIRKNPGDVPVYSCFKEAKIIKGKISADWLKAKKIPIEDKPIVTVNANGASIGLVYVRNERCAITDDVIAVEIVSDEIDPEFAAVQLRSAIEEGNYIYEAKLFAGRVRELKVQLPVKAVGGPIDMDQQKAIAEAVRRFDAVRQKLKELGDWSGSARIR